MLNIESLQTYHKNLDYEINKDYITKEFLIKDIIITLLQYFANNVHHPLITGVNIQNIIVINKNYII